MANPLQDLKVAFAKEYNEKVKKRVLADHKILIRAVYDRIAQRSPIYTGWYKNNHRIKIGGSRSVRLYPQKRPTRRGALIDNHASTRSEEIGKLSRLKAFQTVRIANASTFADTIEARHMVYKIGFVEGLAQAKSEIESRQKK